MAPGGARAGGSLYGALDVKRSSLAPRSDMSLDAARPSGDAGVTVGGELAIGGADFAPRACIRRVPRDPDRGGRGAPGGRAPGGAPPSPPAPGRPSSRWAPPPPGPPPPARHG